MSTLSNAFVMRALEVVKLVFLETSHILWQFVFLRLFDLAVLLCVIQVVVVQAQRKKEEERKAAEEAEALNQEENEQPQAMDTTDGSLHEDIPTNPSEVEFEAVSICLEVYICVPSNVMFSFVVFFPYFVSNDHLTWNSFLNPWDVPVTFLVNQFDSDSCIPEEQMASILTNLS
jgi:hypothetical protein